MKILVINAGSSSLKYQLIDMDTENVMAKGLCERIGIDGSKLNHTPGDADKVVIEKPMKDHADAINMVIAALVANGVTEVYNLKYIDRGYENFEQKLQALGAQIVRKTDDRTAPEQGVAL